jgi:hypothetical protein
VTDEKTRYHSVTTFFPITKIFPTTARLLKSIKRCCQLAMFTDEKDRETNGQTEVHDWLIGLTGDKRNVIGALYSA